MVLNGDTTWFHTCLVLFDCSLHLSHGSTIFLCLILYSTCLYLLGPALHLILFVLLLFISVFLLICYDFAIRFGPPVLRPDWFCLVTVLITWIETPSSTELALSDTLPCFCFSVLVLFCVWQTLNVHHYDIVSLKGVLANKASKFGPLV